MIRRRSVIHERQLVDHGVPIGAQIPLEEEDEK